MEAQETLLRNGVNNASALVLDKFDNSSSRDSSMDCQVRYKKYNMEAQKTLKIRNGVNNAI
jgi:hypothetical protein